MTDNLSEPDLHDIRIRLLALFFKAMDAFIIDLRLEGKIYFASVGWKNELEQQRIKWIPPDRHFNYYGTMKLLTYLSNEKLVSVDKIKVSRENLERLLMQASWTTKNVESAIDSLCSIRVNMIDGGEETDYFFVHF